MRVDEAVKQAAADGMPALALTDTANVFGMVKFYGAARAAGVKAGHRRRLLAAERGRPRQAVPRCCCFAQSRAGLPAPVRAAVARLAEEPAPRARRDRAGLAGAKAAPKG